MSATKTFFCSFCEKPIRFQENQLLRRGKCPHCQRSVTILDNAAGDASLVLDSTWYYRKLRLLFGTQDVGPVKDDEFLQLIRDQRLEDSTEVMSPELTQGKWTELRRVKVAVVQQNVEQRIAEKARWQRVAERQQKADAENRVKLQRAIRSAVESGTIVPGHRQAIERFAIKAGIPASEVHLSIAQESQRLVRQVVDDALADGVLEPSEEKQISQLAISLGVELSFTSDEQRRISLCRLAHSLDAGIYAPSADTTFPFRFGPKEFPLAHAPVRWHEIVEHKRPQGIPLGSGQYLKLAGEGEGYLTTRQVTMIGALQSRKVLLTSVQRAIRYSDGVLFNRSSGKSVFLELDALCESGGHFALLAEHGVSGEPVLGLDPTETFIPQSFDFDESAGESARPSEKSRAAEPRYTFRVVGDHVDGRSTKIQALRPGNRLHIVREPENPFDSNAVAVFNDSGVQMGYLKREVAAWFSPILLEKPVSAKVHRITEYGSLIVGVYL